MDSQTKSVAHSISYLYPFRYLSGNIIEYDIRQANINMLFYKGLIDENKYNYFRNIPKQQREVMIGNMIKNDNTMYKAIASGIAEFKVKLFESNDIQIHEVVRIASDAVYINRSIPLRYTEFDNVIFVNKNKYQTYVNLNKTILLIKYIGNQLDVDVKGISEDRLKDHQNYLLSFIVNIICTMERNSIEEAIKETNEFIEEYINRSLPLEYYREFNSESMYRVAGGQFLIENIFSLDSIDINYNLIILRELLSILYEQYQSSYKRV